MSSATSPPINPHTIFPTVFEHAAECPEIEYHRGTSNEFHGLVLLAIAADILYHFTPDATDNSLRNDIVIMGRDMGTARIGHTHTTMWNVVRDIAGLWVADATSELTEDYLENLLFNTLVRAYDRFLKSPDRSVGHLTAWRINHVSYRRWGSGWNRGVEVLRDLQAE